LPGAIEPGSPLDRAVDDWFVGRGLPHFIPGYSAARDVLTRSAPLLAVVFVIECVTALETGWPWWLYALAIAGGIVGALAVWVGVNRLRGRPLWSRPSRVGAPQIAAFVLLPGLVRMVLHGSNPLTTIAANALLVLAVYFGTSYGVIPIARWGTVRLAAQLSEVVGLVARALPLLLIFVFVFFLTGEVWQLVGGLYGWSYWLTLSLFVVLGMAFMLLRVPTELAQLARFASWSEIRAELPGTPLADAGFAGIDPPVMPPQSRREHLNAMLVLVFSQAVQTLAVVAVMGAFLTTFGIIAMQESTIETYILREPNVIAEWSLLGERQITEELLRVVGFLCSFSGLYFTVVGLTDQLYRTEFVERVLREIRQALAVRAVHRLLRSS
jgi:hypothetical protein